MRRVSGRCAVFGVSSYVTYFVHAQKIRNFSKDPIVVDDIQISDRFVTPIRGVGPSRTRSLYPPPSPHPALIMADNWNTLLSRLASLDNVVAKGMAIDSYINVSGEVRQDILLDLQALNAITEEELVTLGSAGVASAAGISQGISKVPGISQRYSCAATLFSPTRLAHD